MFWEISYEDIKTRVRLYMGERQALISQEFQTLAQVVKMAFGSDEKAKKEAELANIPKPKSAGELRHHFNKVFG
ncbi:MAG TPA: hypothetical protein VEC99_05715 [Clostridia bacterium]|nr:hypothetical protein [Clostridia bacterium]